MKAQSKKDLIAELETVKASLSVSEAALTESNKNAKVSEAKAETYKQQLTELQETNAELLKNLNNFTASSNEKLNSIGSVLENLKEKEAQIQFITDALTRNDSTALLVLTNFKQTLGEDAKISVVNGAVSVQLDKSSVFGSSTGSQISAGASEVISKIAMVINANPQMVASIETSSTSAEQLGSAFDQSNAIIKNLVNSHKIKPERLLGIGKVSDIEGIQIQVHPNFKAFYLNTRTQMKNGRKR
jgi:chromosome segregation ATPase